MVQAGPSVMLLRRTEKFLSGLKSPLLGRQRTAVVVRSVPVCLDWGKTLGDHPHHGQLTGETFSSILTRQQTILNLQNLLFLYVYMCFNGVLMHNE